jgi:hypothetical protein
MEVICYSETSADFHWTTRPCTPKDRTHLIVRLFNGRVSGVEVLLDQVTGLYVIYALREVAPLGGPYSLSEHYGGKKNLLTLPVIEPRFLGRPVRILVAIPSDLSLLHEIGKYRQKCN